MSVCGKFPGTCRRAHPSRLAAGLASNSAELYFSLHVKNDPQLATGSLNPPSVIAIVYAGIANVSLGRLYFASFLPGLLLAGLDILYIVLPSVLQPGLCPSIPRKNAPTWKEKFAALGKVILPTCIIILVLGGIYGGVTTPTEAAGVEAGSAFVVALLKRRFTVLKCHF